MNNHLSIRRDFRTTLLTAQIPQQLSLSGMLASSFREIAYLDFQPLSLFECTQCLFASSKDATTAHCLEDMSNTVAYLSRTIFLGDRYSVVVTTFLLWGGKGGQVISFKITNNPYNKKLMKSNAIKGFKTKQHIDYPNKHYKFSE